MTNIFLLDNFDSFTYNLVDQFRTLGYPVRIYRNSLPASRIMQEIDACEGDAVLVLSRAGRPHEAGCLIDLIKLARGRCPSSASASVIRPCAKPTAAPSGRRGKSSTASAR
jgi:anthranilate synthase component 2